MANHDVAGSPSGSKDENHRPNKSLVPDINLYSGNWDALGSKTILFSYTLESLGCLGKTSEDTMQVPNLEDPSEGPVGCLLLEGFRGILPILLTPKQTWRILETHGALKDMQWPPT